MAAAGWEWGAAQPGRAAWRDRDGRCCSPLAGGGRWLAGWASARAGAAVVGGRLRCGCWAARWRCAAGPRRGRSCRGVARWALGLLALWAAWLALAQARGDRHQLHAVGVVPRLDGRHRGLLRRPRASASRKLAPAISPGKSWEGVWSRHGRRAAARRRLDRGSTRRFAVDGASLFTRCSRRFGVVGAGAGAAGAGRPERGRRPVRVAGQARRRRQGQQPAAAGPWRRARPRRRAAAGAAGCAGAGQPGRAAAHEHAPQRLAILGSTGSIGVSTLDVVARHPERFEVFGADRACSASTCCSTQCRRFRPRFAVRARPRRARAELREPAGSGRRRDRGAGRRRRRCANWPRTRDVDTRDGRHRRRRRPARRAWRRRAPASGCCWPTRKRWSSAARCSCDAVAAGRRDAAADRQRTLGDLPVPARGPRRRWRARIDHIVLTASRRPVPRSATRRRWTT